MSLSDLLAHRKPKHNFGDSESTSRLVFRLVPLLLLLSIQSAIGTTAPNQDNSLAQLQKCQEDYCQELQGLLNSPIHWRVVLDTSGSYARKAGLREAFSNDVEALLRQLPRHNGDSVTIDGFSAGYRPSEAGTDGLTPCLLDSFDGGLQQPVAQCLSHLLDSMESEATQPNQQPDYCFSDFQNTLAQISATKSTITGVPKTNNPIERYFYLIVTDGKNEPLVRLSQEISSVHGCGPPQPYKPLFARRPSPFLEILSAFTREIPLDGGHTPLLTRGLIFIITPLPSPGNHFTIPSEIFDDWRKLHEPASVNQYAQLSHVKVIFHTPGDSFDSLSETLRNLTTRGEKTLPCLYSGEVSFPSSAMQCKDFLRLSPSEMRDSSQSLALPLLLLSSGNPDLTVTTEVTSLYDRSKRIGPSTSIPAAKLDNWQVRRFEIPLRVSADRLNGARLPVKLTVSLKAPESTRTLASIRILSPTVRALLGDFFRKERATLQLSLAVIFLCAGLLWCYYYFGLVAISSVILTSASFSDTTKIHKPAPHGIRYRVNKVTGTIDKMEWSPGSPENQKSTRKRIDHGPKAESKGDFFYLDLSLLSSLPYFIVWASQGGYPRLVSGEDSYSGKDPFSLLTPRSVWVPYLATSGHKVRRYLNGLRTLSWAQTIAVELDHSGSKKEFKLLIYRPGKSLVCGVLASLFLSLGAIFAILGALALLPDSDLSFAQTRAWDISIAVAFLLRILVAICRPMLQLCFPNRWSERAGIYLRFARSAFAHLLAAVFCGFLVAACSGWPLGNAVILSAVFLIGAVLLSTYFKMTPRRRIERQKPLREDDFWLESTFWLWGRMNL